LNRGEIRNRVLWSLREEAAPLRRFSDAELNLYIDDAYVDIAEKTGVVVETVNIAVGAGQHFVPLPANTLFPLAVKDLAADWPIDPTTWHWIDSVDRLWIRRTRARPWVYASWGLTHILLYPAYNVAGTINMMQAIVPVAFGQDSEEPDIPEEYHQALVHYAHHRALLKDADGPRLGRALRQLGYYREMLEDVRDYSNDRHEGIRTAVYGNRLRTPARLELG